MLDVFDQDQNVGVLEVYGNMLQYQHGVVA